MGQMKDDIDYNLDQVENVLQAMIASAEIMANEIARPFWERSQELRKDKSINTAGWFKFSLYIRKEEPTAQRPSERLTVTWKKLKWVTTQKGPQLYSDTVRKKADGTYAMSSFKAAGPEELSMIEAINREMQKVRDTLKFVGNVRKTRSNIFRKYNNRD